MGAKTKIDTLWLIPFHIQKKAIKELCFEKCGKVITGAVEYGIMPCFPCRTKECKYVDKEVEGGVCELSHGKEKIILRKLKTDF